VSRVRRLSNFLNEALPAHAARARTSHTFEREGSYWVHEGAGSPCAT
jgi:hypothetical protein